MIALRTMLISAAAVQLSANAHVLAQNAPTTTARVVWTTADREDITMSSVSRLVVDAQQRAFVVEDKENVIYVYDAAGVYLTKFGRKGAGPGEFGTPCCASFDAKGRLWVQDGDNSRYVVFSIAENGKSVKASPAFVVKSPNTTSNFQAPINIDSDGNVTSLAQVRQGTDQQTFVKRYVVDSTGKTVRTLLESPQTENITPPFKFPVPNSTNSVVLYLYQPYGGVPLRAEGPNGVYAKAGSGKYAVSWFSATGALLRTLTRDVQGPALSSRERVRGDSILAARAKRGQTTISGLPFGLPERKPTLSALFFDADGRLWVERTAVDGAPHEADVYRANGTLAFRATWPANIELASAGFIRGSAAWGISLDSDDVPHVVRLEFAVPK